MTVKLHSFSRKYVGLSRDVKPVTDASDTVPVGSTFHETDTGRVEKWDGYRWTSEPFDSEALDLLREIVTELRIIRELHMTVVADGN